MLVPSVSGMSTWIPDSEHTPLTRKRRRHCFPSSPENEKSIIAGMTDGTEQEEAGGSKSSRREPVKESEN